MRMKSHLDMKRFCLLSALLLTGASLAPRVYRNDAMKVRAFDPPEGWLVAPQASYPKVLALYTHDSGARLTLTAQKVAAGVTGESLAESSRATLEREGFRDIALSPGRIDAALSDGKRFLKQIYLVQSGFGYVVSLVGPKAPAARATRLVQDFDDAVHSLQLEPETAPVPSR